MRIYRKAAQGNCRRTEDFGSDSLSLLTGDRLPEITYLVKVAEHFHVSLDWLVGLSGDKYELMPPELQEVASLYGAANADDKRVVQAVLQKYRLEEKADDGKQSSGDNSAQ